MAWDKVGERSFYYGQFYRLDLKERSFRFELEVLSVEL